MPVLVLAGMCGACGSATAQAVAASTAGEASRADGRVVITATRTATRIDQALADVTLIGRQEIEAAGGRTLVDLLARQAGVLAWSNGGPGTPAALSLRGMESRHTLLLIDGVRYGSATLGTPIWENLPLDAIERIEIVRGPMSGLYGSDAVGGVVHIFTRRGSAGFEPDVTLVAGSHGTAEVAAGARFGSGPIDAHLRLQHLRTRGFSATNAQVPFGQFDPDDDGYRQSSVQARVGARLGAWRAEASLLGSQGVVHYDDGAGSDARADLRTALQSLGLDGPVAHDWRMSLRLARSQDRNDVRASASPFTDLGATGTVQRQFSWENQLATPWGTLLALAERVQQDVSRPGVPYEVSRRTISGLALGLNGAQGPHSWQASLRRDRNSQFGRPTTGSLAYGLELLPGLRATVSGGKSFVAPSFNQLYYPGFGNPLLQPEQGRQNEFALRWQGAQASARVAYFEHRLRGYISSGPAPTNIPRTRIDGVSASADAVLGAWSLSASFDSLNPLNATPGSTDFGKLLLRRTTESARLSADWQGPALALGATLAAHGARFDDAANTLHVPGHATLDLRADWRAAPGWTLGLRLNNALNKVYETVYGYNQAPRQGFVSLRWSGR